MKHHTLIAIAIALSIAINAAAIAAFLTWSTDAAASAARHPAYTGKIVTLAPIDVHPSAAEPDALRHVNTRRT